MTRPSGENEHDKRSRINLSHPLIVAIIPALILAAGTYFAGARTGHVLGLAPAPTVTETVTATSTSTSGGGGIGTQTVSGKTLFQKKGVQLTSGYGLSFTDPALRPFSSGCLGAELYICDGVYVGSSAQLADYDGRAGFSQCQADTTYATGNNIFGLLVNHTLCVTTSNRIAACYVTQDTTQESVPAPGLTMDCTVYALK